MKVLKAAAFFPPRVGNILRWCFSSCLLTDVCHIVTSELLAATASFLFAFVFNLVHILLLTSCRR